MPKKTRIVATLMRPTGTSAYSAGQIVNTSAGTPIPLPGAVRGAGGSGYLIGFQLSTPESNTSVFRIHLFKNPDPVLANDSTDMTIDNIDIAAGNYLGSFDLAAAAEPTGGGPAIAQKLNDLRHPIIAADGSTTIYAVLQVVSGDFTPSDSQVFTMIATVEPD